MDISTTSNTVNIIGNIKSVADYQTIKNTLDSMKSNHTSIILNISDSISMTSSVIGYLNKLVLKDNITININIGNAQLMELFEDLNLVSLFHVRKV
ncbi:hypothetical protein [Sulfurimonas sp.]